MGISNSLPKTGYIKMVDIWMIFTMSYPFIVITLHCFQQVSILVYLLAGIFAFWNYILGKMSGDGEFMREQMACTNERRFLKSSKFRLYNCTYWYHMVNFILRYIAIKIYSRSFGKAAVKYLLWPVLPIWGIIFTLIFFSIGIYIYKFQDIQHSALCI